MTTRTFIVDCPVCKAKVAAQETGRADRSYFDPEVDLHPHAEMLQVGKCPECDTLLVGQSEQVDFEGVNADKDGWSNVVRVFPNPPKTFSSRRIPKVALSSLDDADRSLQANANFAACVMFGRALEAVCRAKLLSNEARKGGKKIMLAAGIKQLRDKKIIDARLFDWSQELNAFRNFAAHPDEGSISREDAEDLQAFAYAIIEYIYDLTERYEEFKSRVGQRKKKR